MSAAEAFFESRERNVFVATTPAAQVLEALEQGLDHALPIVLLTGEAGVGKTATLREAVARWSSRVQAAWLDASKTSTSTIFADTIRAFGGHVRGKDRRPEQVGRLTHALGVIRQKGLTPLLVVDSAQVLDNEALTELGRIESASSAAGFELKMILAGRPDLVDRLASDQHEPIEVHVGVRTVLGRMSLADTREYLTHVLGGQTTEGDEVFPRKSAREIHDGADGIPARVNALADEAIRCAQAAGSAQVGPEHVRAVLAAAFPSTEGAEVVATDTTAGPEAAADGGATPSDGPPAEAAPAAEPQPESGARPAIPEKPRRIAAHKPPDTPAGAAARVPPPPVRKRALPKPPATDLDSSHPRVRDWVARFTAGQPPIRFGGRTAPPAGELSELLPAEPPESSAPAAPAPADAPTARPARHGAGADAGVATPAKAEHPRNRRLERARDAEASRKLQPPVAPPPKAVPADAAAGVRAGQAPEPAARPSARESAVQAKSAAAPPRAGSQPPPADLTHIARQDPAPLEVPVSPPPAPVPLEVTPEQLTPPPLVLDESPAAAAPEPRESVASAQPAPSFAEPPRLATPRSTAPTARPGSQPAPQSTPPALPESRHTPAARPAGASLPSEQPGLARAAEAPRPAPHATTPDAGTPAPLSRKQQKAAARRAERLARRAAEAQARAAARPAPPAAKPASSVPAPASASARTESPVVLTHEAVRPVSAAPATGAKSVPGRASTASPVATTVSHLRPAKANDVPGGDLTPPRIDRVLAVLIPAVLILGMAIAAFILGRRGAFDRHADAGTDLVDPVTAAAPTTPAAVADSAVVSALKADSVAEAEARPFEPPVEEPFTEPDPEPSAGPARYCLAVGTYLFEDRAREKARTLAGRTGQKAWVEPVRVSGQRSYRILFGAYASEGAAERDADRLLSRGFVTEAMVENLPAPRRRR